MPNILAKTLLLLAFVGFAALAQESATAPADEEGTARRAASPDTDAETDAVEPAATAPAAGRVRDEIELSRTEITGNQELPKVLYIVPWQKSDPGDLTGKPVNTLLDEVLAPIDRSQFLRRVDYYAELYGTDED